MISYECEIQCVLDHALSQIGTYALCSERSEPIFRLDAETCSSSLCTGLCKFDPIFSAHNDFPTFKRAKLAMGSARTAQL